MADMLTIMHGDCRDRLKELPDGSVHCVVTSPPYFRLRDYGTAKWEGGAADCLHESKRSAQGQTGQRADRTHTQREIYKNICALCGAVRVDQQIGLEETPQEFISTMVAVFREVRRVLRSDGTLWLNIGDSYNDYPANVQQGGKLSGRNQHARHFKESGYGLAAKGMKPKDLMQIPARLALALQSPYYTGNIKNESDRIWLAAMVDGEGCIFLHKQPVGTITGRGRKSLRTQDNFCAGLDVTNTSRAIVEKCARLIGGTIRCVRSKGNRRDHFTTRVTGNKAKEVLREIYPSLVAKRQEARLAIACPPSGDVAASTWQALRNVHNGIPTEFDSEEPDTTSLWEPGWYLRSEIVWSKPNPMPESVTDRPTRSHEMVYLLTKQAKYFYDAEAVKESRLTPMDSKSHQTFGVKNGKAEQAYGARVSGEKWIPSGLRNRRSVWTIPTQPTPDAHFATFPQALVEPCIMAGTSARGCCATCGAPYSRVVEPSPEYAKLLGKDWSNQEQDDSEGRGHFTLLDGGRSAQRPVKRNAPSVCAEYVTTGWKAGCECAAAIVPCTVLDPFFGSGTVGKVAINLGRRAIGIELNADYIKIGERKCQTQIGLAL